MKNRIKAFLVPAGLLASEALVHAQNITVPDVTTPANDAVTAGSTIMLLGMGIGFAVLTYMVVKSLARKTAK